MKRIVSLVLVLALALGACLALTSCGEKFNKVVLTDDAVITIGVFEPASGDNGAGGKQETLGVKYANHVKDTVTIGGKQYKVKLEIVDNQSSNDKAPTAAAELVNKNALVVLGSYGSGVSIAAGETFKQAGVPAIGITCTNPGVTSGNDHYFRACFLDPFQGTVLANYAKSLDVEKAYVLAQLGNDYDVGLATYFKQAFGESACVYENFQLNESNFTSYVQKAIDQKCGVIFSPTSLSYATLIIEKANELGYEGLILAGDTWDSNVVTEAAKGKNVKIDVTTFYQEGANAEFDRGFSAWLESDANILAENGGNTMISAVSAMGYDTYMAALDAIEKAELTTEKGNNVITSAAIRNALDACDKASAAYTGVTGAIYYDDNGDAVRDAAFIKSVNTKDGTWDFVKKQGIDK